MKSLTCNQKIAQTFRIRAFFNSGEDVLAHLASALDSDVEKIGRLASNGCKLRFSDVESLVVYRKRTPCWA